MALSDLRTEPFMETSVGWVSSGRETLGGSVDEEAGTNSRCPSNSKVDLAKPRGAIPSSGTPNRRDEPFEEIFGDPLTSGRFEVSGAFTIIPGSIDDCCLDDDDDDDDDDDEDDDEEEEDDDD